MQQDNSFDWIGPLGRVSASGGIPTGDKIDVFISFASEDQELAQKIHDLLTANGRHPVFFSPASIRESDFTNSIFDALEKTRNLIVVGSKIDHLHKNWVNYEYTSFFRKKMRGGEFNRQIFTVLSNLAAGTRPPAPLDDYTCVSFDDDLGGLLDSLE